MQRPVMVIVPFFMCAAVIVGCGSGLQNPAAPKVAVVAGAAKAEANAAGKTVDRKIRYTATVEIVVKNLDSAADAVETLVTSKGGFIAKSDLTGAVGERRTGHWTMKVPVDTFRDVIAALTKLGTLVRNTSDSEDLTEEFLDLEARLRNLKTEEEVLNKLLKDTVSRLDDVLKMREQIAKTRGEIEQAEGRLKFLTTVTSFSTITLTLREIQDYVPPVTPTFASVVTDTFSTSLTNLVRFGEGLALVIVGLAPWLPLLAVFGFAVSRFVRLIPWRRPIAVKVRRPARVTAVAASEADAAGSVE